MRAGEGALSVKRIESIGKPGVLLHGFPALGLGFDEPAKEGDDDNFIVEHFLAPVLPSG